MKLLAPHLAVGLVLAVLSPGQQDTSVARADGEGRPRPNIILFLVDDMGWQDTSVPFAEQPTPWNALYRTPHMEALARRGVKFTQAYAAHPVCSPTRTSMMTGKNPARTHIDDWVGHGYTGNRYLRSPKWAATGLQPEGSHVTLPEVLAGQGYRTIHVGKAHFGGKGTAGADPTNLGFDCNVAGSHTGGPWGGWISPWLGKHAAVYPNLEDRPKGEYLTHAITVKAIDLVGQAVRDGKPFFLNMAHFAVHTRIAPAPAYIAGYQDGRPEVEADYASMIEAMDASLGMLLARLRDPDGDGDERDSVADNTLVFFMSDNGGLSNHTRASVGKVDVRLGSGDVVEADLVRDWHNRPLRSGKGSAYEGGYRIPMIVAWAGQASDGDPLHPSLPIGPGSVVGEPVHMDDFYPTVLDVAGVDNPIAEQERDGQSLLPLLAGRLFERRRPLFWHYPHQWYEDIGTGLGIEPFSAMRKGRHKLIYFYGDGVADGEGNDPRVELYDLEQDLGEAHNLAASQTALCVALRDELVTWLRTVGAGIPIVKGTGEPAALPAPSQRAVTFRVEEVTGIGREAGICRRDPSDVIRVGDRFFVYYTRVVKSETVPGRHRYPSGYQGDVWCAVSEDEGRKWKELGVAVARGSAGEFDCTGVFTPNILGYEGRYWLYYTAVGPGFDNGPYAAHNRTSIGVASADSPEGPWRKCTEPVLESTREPERFDSYRVDDACLRVVEGKIWLYFKGRQWENTPAFTQMGVAMAAQPSGPFVRLREGKPVQSAGHEVQVFELDDGVYSLVSPTRGADSNSLRFAADGIAFDAEGAVVARCKPRPPMAPGLYRPELTGEAVGSDRRRWGISMGSYGGDPYLMRFEFEVPGRR